MIAAIVQEASNPTLRMWGDSDDNNMFLVYTVWQRGRILNKSSEINRSLILRETSESVAPLAVRMARMIESIEEIMIESMNEHCVRLGVGSSYFTYVYIYICICIYLFSILF